MGQFEHARHAENKIKVPKRIHMALRSLKSEKVRKISNLPGEKQNFENLKFLICFQNSIFFMIQKMVAEYDPKRIRT